MEKTPLTTHELARLLLEMDDLPVATNVGYESCFARDLVIEQSLVQLQQSDNDIDKPDGISADKWVLIGGDGFSEN